MRLMRIVMCFLATVAVVACQVPGSWPADLTASSFYPTTVQPFPLQESKAAEVVYYVDCDGGSDSNPGTSRSQAWRTIQRAANTMIAGDTLVVLAGVCEERVYIGTSGRADAPIVYSVEGTVTTKGFQIDADYITIQGFKVTGTDDHFQDGFGIYVTGSHCILQDNLVYMATYGGILLTGSSRRCTVRDNRLHKNAMSGIGVAGQDHLIEGNEIWETIQYHPEWATIPDWADADGILFFGSGHVFRLNDIHDITYEHPLVDTAHIDCFQTWAEGPDGSGYEAGHDILFEKNYCDALTTLLPEQSGRGFTLEGGAHNLTIMNNIIKAYGGLQSDNTAQGIGIYNNLFIGDLELTACNYAFGIFYPGHLPSVARNNLFYDINDTPNALDECPYGSDGPIYNGGGLDSDHNLASRSDGQMPRTGEYETGPHDMWGVDPLFVNPDMDDFHLTLASPAIDAGAAVDQVVDDYDDIPRPQGDHYDIGIYEYPNTVVIYTQFVYLPFAVR